MTIEHANTSSTDRPAQQSDRVDGKQAATDAPREAPPKEQVDRFRQLMQHGRQDGRVAAQEPGQAGQATEAGTHGTHGARAAAGHGMEHVAQSGAQAQGELQDAIEGVDNNGMGANSLEGGDLLAMMQAQAALREGAGMPAPTAPAPPMASGKALAEMLERHVRQLAVDEAASADGDGHVLLRMSDATLPGTDLLLSRTADGWHLRADVRSRGSFDAIRDAAPALAKRFAELDLGRLEIDPQFNG